MVTSILDIDLDYFNLVSDPVQELSEMLAWANRPVDILADKHADAMRRWVELVASGKLSSPSHILHADEHHDMMDQKSSINIANVMYHAMSRWPKCRVYWMTQDSIDTPAMWLDDNVWKRLRTRFRTGNKRPRKWPTPDFLSVTVSADFIRPDLKDTLMDEIMRREKKWHSCGRLHTVEEH
ncbi:MAG TPA: hypothetical protein DET40_24335 [Lentisphaeria bacterium]|nr:MAG: hypothetical protein A2X45_00095 [Lentisphaerae bacterium GWF2_50_93]HCE46688.1 hypothetical protein [Lentisphaeria bacterium]